MHVKCERGKSVPFLAVKLVLFFCFSLFSLRVQNQRLKSKSSPRLSAAQEDKTATPHHKNILNILSSVSLFYISLLLFSLVSRREHFYQKSLFCISTTKRGIRAFVSGSFGETRAYSIYKKR